MTESNQPCFRTSTPIGSTGSHSVNAVSSATTPMYSPSADLRLRVTQSTKPTNSTMNDAPSREPLIIANASMSEVVPEENRLSEIAATGEPLITMYEPSQPNPSRLSTPSA